MKFEKFFKMAGTHGMIVKKSDTESWLLCAGVGMRIPDGVNNLGASVEPDRLFKAIVSSEPDDDYLTLKEAKLFEPDGKLADVLRIFETDLGDRVGIWNGHYGLLEKKDALTYLEVETTDPNREGHTLTAKYLVVRDRIGDAIGFITGSDRI